MSHAPASSNEGCPDSAATRPVTEERLTAMEALSAAELSQRLGGVATEDLRLRERAGELFSVVFVGRQPHPVFPAFQAWPGISGTPLRTVLHALGFPATDGAAMYGFFTAANDLLGDLTPVEAMAGQLLRRRDIPDYVATFLSEPPSKRLHAVVGAAQAYLADLSS